MSRKRQKTLNIASIRSVFNEETGELHRELKEFNSTTINTDAEPSFVKLYFEDIQRLNDLPKSTSAVMYELLQLMNYENIITLSPYVRQSIANKLNTTTTYINKSICKFIDSGLFHRLGTNTYFVNPNIFGKGKWADIKSMRLTITYDEKGRIVKCDRQNHSEEFLNIKIAGLPK